MRVPIYCAPGIEKGQARLRYSFTQPSPLWTLHCVLDVPEPATFVANGKLRINSAAGLPTLCTPWRLREYALLKRHGVQIVEPLS
jgi:hypothetical protein